MFTTRTQVIDYLVAQGKPAPLVKALVTEYLNHDPVDLDTRDIIWRDEDLCIDNSSCFAFTGYTLSSIDGHTGMVPVQVSEAWCNSFWAGQAELVRISDDGQAVLFDNERIFDLNGHYLNTGN